MNTCPTCGLRHNGPTEFCSGLCSEINRPQLGWIAENQATRPIKVAWVADPEVSGLQGVLLEEGEYVQEGLF